MSINRGGKRGYPPEFRAQAVELYRSSGLSFARVATDLGVSIVTLKAWVKQAEINAGEREGWHLQSARSWWRCDERTGCCAKSVKY
jgi:transposase-like protein